MSATAGLLVAIVSLLVSAVFAALHLSLRTLVRTHLTELIEEEGVSAAVGGRVRRILADVDGHCVALGLPRILTSLLVAVGLLVWFVGPAGPISPEGAWSAPLAELLLAVTVSSVALWLFAFLVPGSIADHLGERLLVRLSWLVRLTYIATRPVIGVSRLIDEVVRRLAKVDAQREQEVLEAELLSVVEEGRAEGQFDETEQDMIEAVVEFRTTSVEQIMTPRTEIRALVYTDDLDEVKAFVRDGGHSRIPVYRDNLDNIAGVLYAKDLLRWMSSPDAETPFRLDRILRQAVFVPETKTVRQLMAELLAQKVHIAMVIDEYGGTAGLVTFEDIVEEIFGEIQDEYEESSPPLPEVVLDDSSRSATIDARIHVDDANDMLEPIRLQIPDAEDYDTVGGFVTVRLGRIPAAGETFVADRLVVEVLEAEPTRVIRVRVAPAPNGEGGEGAPDASERAAAK